MSQCQSTALASTGLFHVLACVGGVLYREDLLDRALEAYNDTMRSVAAEHGVPVFDLSRVIPKSLTYFYDDAHFNVEGARFFGDHLGGFIAQQLTAARPGPPHPAN